MKKVTNPDTSGANIVNYRVGVSPSDTSAKEYTILMGESIEVEDYTADYFVKTFGFLKISELDAISIEEVDKELDDIMGLEGDAPEAVGEQSDEVEGEEEVEVPSIDNMKLSELRKLAKEKGIKVPFISRKVDIIHLLSNK